VGRGRGACDIEALQGQWMTAVDVIEMSEGEREAAWSHLVKIIKLMIEFMRPRTAHLEADAMLPPAARYVSECSGFK